MHARSSTALALLSRTGVRSHRSVLSCSTTSRLSSRHTVQSEESCSTSSTEIYDRRQVWIQCSNTIQHSPRLVFCCVRAMVDMVKPLSTICHTCGHPSSIPYPSSLYRKCHEGRVASYLSVSDADMSCTSRPYRKSHEGQVAFIPFSLKC